MLPVVAIVGRPNVGKSTLFNRLVGERWAIVDDRPGITRDRLYREIEWLNRRLVVVDTGGIEPYPADEIGKNVRAQAELAIDEADVVLFVVDGQTGPLADDVDVAEKLRRSGKPIVLAVNKIDHPKHLERRYDFYALGLGEPYGISAAHGTGIGELMDAVLAALPPAPEGAPREEEGLRIAIVGRPNVGKSSLLNALAGEERAIVSPVPGTTRDAVDTVVERAGERFVLVDTAGIRRRGRIYERAEKYSVLRAELAMRRADVVFVVLDATVGVVEQDKHIAGAAERAGRGLLLVVNKWDLVDKDDKTYDRFVKTVREELDFVAYAPVEIVSARTGQRVGRLFDLARQVAENHALRLPTSRLNDVLQEAIALTPPPSRGGAPLRIKYATQVGTKPPTIALFVNDPERLHFSYARYLENRFREAFPLTGTPLRFVIKPSDPARARSERS
ncbi:ribosome biogenesis GTPase Der [Hydrogenibacillus schlegelii]|nr:ribosome biogenesis GTPase Der [Hydrogenibacillus schlegelii]KWX07712.1 GTP-binding protein Der [Hydrogenibacillus schlegelii]OAR05628.1 ribosome-associated GTPase EngA [Hydrogenibacillus schlegelii]